MNTRQTPVWWRFWCVFGAPATLWAMSDVPSPLIGSQVGKFWRVQTTGPAHQWTTRKLERRLALSVGLVRPSTVDASHQRCLCKDYFCKVKTFNTSKIARYGSLMSSYMDAHKNFLKGRGLSSWRVLNNTILFRRTKWTDEHFYDFRLTYARTCIFINVSDIVVSENV